MNDNLKSTRNLLTVALILNTVAWFIPDMFFPDSHFRSSVWPLHARLHTGGAATVNMVYILAGLFLVWRPRFDLRTTMQFVAGGLALWNLVFIVFAFTATPLIMEAGDTYVSWSTDPTGAGNDHGVGVEGWVLLMAGVPALLFLWVLRRLRVN